MTHADAHSPDPAAADPFAAALAWQLATLQGLGDMCMRLAGACGQQAELALIDEQAQAHGAPEAAAPAVPASDHLKRFDRMARAVRLSVALHGKLLKQAQDRRDRGLAARAARDEVAGRALEETRRTGRLRRAMAGFIVRTAIEAEERERESEDRLLGELGARLMGLGEDDADCAEIDVKQTAWAIARDLGVDPGPDWWMESWGVESDAPPAPDPSDAAPDASDAAAAPRGPP